MRKLFAILALAAAVFTACESNDEGINANLKIKLTSESIMHFGMEGGAGTITYEFENLAEATRNPKPAIAEAATAVAWITDLSCDANKVTFNIAANTDAAREATIKVWYGEHSFMVMIKQDGTVNADKTFRATHLGGTYYGKLQTRGYNYFMILSDYQPQSLASIPYGATEYRLDLYADKGAQFDEVRSIPVGTYKLDHRRSGEPFSIDGYQDCSYLYDYSTGNPYTAPFLDATVVVSEDGIVADITLMSGEVHRVEYSGSLAMEDYTEPTFADIHPVSQYTSDIEFAVEGGEFMPIFRGNWYDSESDVWFVHMIEQKNGFSGVYLLLDLLVPRSNGGYSNKEGFLGEYSLLDPKAESWDYTFPCGRLRDDSMQLHAWYAYCVNSQVDMSLAAPITAGSIKFEKTDDGKYLLTVDGKDDNGNNIKGTFKGIINTYDNQAND